MSSRMPFSAKAGDEANETGDAEFDAEPSVVAEGGEFMGIWSGKEGRRNGRVWARLRAGRVSDRPDEVGNKAEPRVDTGRGNESVRVSFLRRYMMKSELTDLIRVKSSRVVPF